MRVVLSANIPRGYWVAVGLQEAGFLERYICAVGVNRKHRWLYGLLPEYWRKKLEGREIEAVNPARVKSIWLPELLQKGLPRLHLISPERGNWLNNHLYDRLASLYVENCDAFHFTSSVGLYSARRAKQKGATLICDQRSAHPDFEREIVREEYERLGLPHNPPGLLYEGKMKAEYALSDYILVPSSFAKRTFVEAGHEPNRILVVPYGTQVPGEAPAGWDGAERFRVIYVGQVTPRKGVHYLVEAFGDLSLPDAELLLVGPVDREMLPLVRRWVQADPGVEVTGGVPRTELSNYYMQSSVFVLPSVSEGSALVTYEAMASGLPVIVTENCGAAEVVREGTDGFIIPIRSVEALKQRIRLLYKDNKRRKRMGEAARKRAEEFTWERYGERLMSVYREIASRERMDDLVG